MSKQEHEEITRDEIKKEFQLERMIVFSDAVFAIVITLMAMEIKMPESAGHFSVAELPGILLHLAPTFFAYCVSFFFIGAIWYTHLKMFSILKDYDKGLVVRNLFLLFLIGLFPFSATVITVSKGAVVAFYMYMSVIFLCILAQYILYHYIMIKRPSLCVKVNMDEHFEELRKRKIALICFSAAAVLIVITNLLIDDPQIKPLATLWMMVFPITYRILTRKKKSALLKKSE